MRPFAALIGLLALFGAGGAAAAEPWPELPLPPHAQVQWVGDSMRINGIPTRILRFESAVSRQEIVEFYRAHWAGANDRPPPAVNEVDGATVVGQAHGPYFMTAKVRSRGRDASEGLVSVARALGHEVRLDAGDIALMPDARLVSVVESEDPGRRSRQIVAVNSAGLDSVRRFYAAALKDRGWLLVQEGGPPPAAAGAAGRGHFAIYQRRRQELQLSVVPAPSGNGAVVIANLVAHDAMPELTR